MALMRSMTAPTMGERASILERIMAVQHTGIVAPGTPMALGADRPRGTTAREAPQVGAGGAVAWGGSGSFHGAYGRTGDGDGDERQPAGSLPTQKPKRKTQNCLRR